jgi:hypothetical protein
VDGGPTLPTTVRHGLVRRVLFTELDHLFINPVSATSQREIDRAFGDVARWSADRSGFYPTATDTFNEYMTWSVFFLFADGRLPLADFDRLVALSTQVMVTRGFSRFDDFNRALLELWRTREPGTRVVDLFPAILAWAGA